MEKCRKIVVYRIETGIVVERTREGCYSGDNEVHAFDNVWNTETFLHDAVEKLFTPQELRDLHTAERASKETAIGTPTQMPSGAAGCPSTE